jgi:hypothetical protein
MGVQAEFIPDGKSGLVASLASPENFLVALFVLSPTLWLLAFLACYLSAALSMALSSTFQSLQFGRASQLVTLFPDGPPTPRPTFPG